MIIKPTEINDGINNPWMGWGLWAGPIYFDGTSRTLQENTIAFGDDAPLFDWVLLDWMWADLEPEEGYFTWDELDAVIDYWASRGKQINLRVWTTEDPGWNGAPGASEVCPNWLFEAGLHWHDYTGEGNAAKREPDYAHPSFREIYVPRLQNFLNALAARYDKPGQPFNFLGNMSYGQWGEWHTLWSHYLWPSERVKHDILANLVTLYADTFKHTDLAISCCFDSFNYADGPKDNQDHDTWRRLVAQDDPQDFLYRQGLDVALERGYILGRHGFIDGILHTDRVIMEAEWRRRAFYAEGNWSYLDLKNHGTHGTVDENIDHMLEYHSNYGHFYVDAAAYRRIVAEDAERFARGLRPGGLGYRLVLAQAGYPDAIAPGQLLVIRQRWANRNAGRCYKRHPLKLYLIDSAGNTVHTDTDMAFDQTGWVRGETHEVTSVFRTPKDLPEGTYDVRLAMVGWDGAPALRLGVAGTDDQKRYSLGTLQVSEDADRSTHWATGW